MAAPIHASLHSAALPSSLYFVWCAVCTTDGPPASVTDARWRLAIRQSSHHPRRANPDLHSPRITTISYTCRWHKTVAYITIWVCSTLVRDRYITRRSYTNVQFCSAADAGKWWSAASSEQKIIEIYWFSQILFFL